MKKQILLYSFLFVFFIILINLVFFLVRYINLENKSEQYLESDDFILAVSKNVEALDEVGPPTSFTEGLPEKKIAIVIDDLGKRTVRYYLLDMLPYKVNVAIIPGEMHSQELAKHYAEKGNYEILMHMPMEPFATKEDKESKQSKIEGYAYAIISGDNKTAITNKLDVALDSLYGNTVVSGINNHMGSLITSSRPMVDIISKWAKKKKLYVLDSLTTPSSILYEQARKKGVKAAYNQVFLDSFDDIAHIKNQLSKVEKIASRDGSVIAIGHINRANTLEVLFEWMPQAIEDGYSLSFVSEIAQ